LISERFDFVASFTHTIVTVAAMVIAGDADTVSNDILLFIHKPDHASRG
jgi:hypothetical protein